MQRACSCASHQKLHASKQFVVRVKGHVRQRSLLTCPASSSSIAMATGLSKHQSVVLEKLVMSGVDMGAGDFPWDPVHGNWPALKHVDLGSNFHCYLLLHRRSHPMHICGQITVAAPLVSNYTQSKRLLHSICKLAKTSLRLGCLYKKLYMQDTWCLRRPDFYSNRTLLLHQQVLQPPHLHCLLDWQHPYWAPLPQA